MLRCDDLPDPTSAEAWRCCRKHSVLIPLVHQGIPPPFPLGGKKCGKTCFVQNCLQTTQNYKNGVFEGMAIVVSLYPPEMTWKWQVLAPTISCCPDAS